MDRHKNIIKTLGLGLITALFLVVLSSNVNAQSPPDFPACTNPQGNLVVSYSDGNHALPGETFLKSGSDEVYQLGEGNYLQCFCANDGSGVQTNWWKVAFLTQEEIETLIKLGWHFIPDGADWGLEEGAYMAINGQFDCRGSDNNDGGNRSSDENTGGIVLATAASDQKASFAPTGTTKLVFGLFLLGVTFLGISRVVGKKA